MNTQSKNIRKFLSTCNDVTLAFLFGSFANGNVTPSSDLDIAIVFSQKPDFHCVNDLRQRLSETFNITVDIVPLNNASPIIRMQVLKYGILLLNKKPEIYNDFFVKTVAEYDDLKQIRNEIEKNILRGRIYA